MYAKPQHTPRTDEVAHEILSEVEDMGGHVTAQVRGLMRAWMLVTQSRAMDNGIPTPALKNAAERHYKRFS